MERKTRGLGSLISSTTSASQSQLDQATEAKSQLVELPIDNIAPNPSQPRRTFDKDALQRLADSIRQQGVLQPIVVKPVSDGKYELIAGERRWRAVRLAGQTTVPAIVRNLDSSQSLILSVIENLQREDLDPIEEASAYQKMISELAITQEQVAAHVGKERTTVANTIRLLDLPTSIQAKLISRALTQGHARVLLAVTDPAIQADLAEKAANKGMSVRELERLVYGGGGGSKVSKPDTVTERSANLRDIEARLTERLGVRVKLKELRRGGRLVIEFRSNAEFLRILETMGVNTSGV